VTVLAVLASAIYLNQGCQLHMVVTVYMLQVYHSVYEDHSQQYHRDIAIFKTFSECAHKQEKTEATHCLQKQSFGLIVILL